MFHPGDAFTLPGVPVDTLLLPMHGPWSKAGEVLDYARAVAPVRAIPIHDALLSDLARRSWPTCWAPAPRTRQPPRGNLPLGPA